MPKFFDPLFGRVSFEKAAKFIAICDLVLCVLFVLSHFVGVGYVYEEREEQYETELSQDVRQYDSFDQEPNTSSLSSPNPGNAPNRTISYEDLMTLLRIGMPSADMMILIGFLLFALSLVHVCMEVWMCRLLLKAANHKDGSALKHWFWCRTAVTLVLTLYSIVNVRSVKSDFVDWFFLVINIYRAYTMYIIYEFKFHISACANVSRPA